MAAISAGEWSGRWNVGSRAGIVVVQRCCVAVLRCRDFGCLALSCFSETNVVVSRCGGSECEDVVLALKCQRFLL